MTENQIQKIKEEVTPERLYNAFVGACEKDCVCVEDGCIHAHRGVAIIRIDISEV